MWSRCRSEGGLWRDPFGYTGPEHRRPHWQTRLIDARRALDAQEQQIQWHCKLEPERLTYRFPHWPPSDAARRDPARFQRWLREQQWRDDLKQSDGDRSELKLMDFEWEVERDGEAVKLVRASGDLARRVYLWYDPVVEEIGVDRHGNIAEPA